MREQTTVVVNVEKRVKKLSAIGFIATIEIGIPIAPKRVKAKIVSGLLKIVGLSFCFLMGYSIHFDTISMGLPILYFKGSQVEVYKLWCISVPEGCFNLGKQCRP